MPTLLELQRTFLRGVLGAAGEAAAAGELLDAAQGDPARRVGVYANNAAANFLDSLRLSFPAVQRLTGDAYFDQAVARFREDHPSRSGDLQGAGAAFADYLAARHGADAYRYLGDVARLEWLYQESLLAADHAPFDLARLGRVPAAHYDALVFTLHPAARLFESAYPAYTIWDANTGSDAEPPLIDLDAGGERLLIARSGGRSRFHLLDGGEHGFLAALATGAVFADAIAAGADGKPEFDPAKTLQKFVLAGAIVDFSH